MSKILTIVIILLSFINILIFWANNQIKPLPNPKHPHLEIKYPDEEFCGSLCSDMWYLSVSPGGDR